jgi:cytochrome c biogenesis protein ResB
MPKRSKTETTTAAESLGTTGRTVLQETGRTWVAVVGYLFLIASIVQLVRGERREAAWLIAATLLLLLVSSMIVHGRERRHRIQTETRSGSDPRRQILKDQLGVQAQVAQDRAAAYVVGFAERKKAEAEAAEWEEEVHSLIEAALGPGESHLFRVGHSGEWKDPSLIPIWPASFYSTRAHRIADLIMRLPQLTLRDDWQP